MMSYEIVRKAINHESPPRLPVRMGSLGVNDTAGIPVKAPAGWEPRQPGMDEWVPIPPALLLGFQQYH